jgi:hypothetical protein
LNSGAQSLPVSANGAFAFPTALANGAVYAVTVATQPSGQMCAVASGSGTIAGANVGDVTVTCVLDDTIFENGFDGDVLVCEPLQLLQGSGFEETDGDGGDNNFWDSVTTQGDSVFWSTTGGAEHIRNGTYVVWLGGYITDTLDPEVHDASQSVVIPTGAPRFLNYWRWIGREGNGSNTVTFTLDGNVVRTEDLATIGLDADWAQQSIDISAYADGGSHTVKMTYAHSGGDSDWDYYLDDATIDCSGTSSAKSAQTRALIVPSRKHRD